MIERLSVVCHLCDLSVIVGHRSLEEYFGKRIDEVMAALATGEVDFTCARCAGEKRRDEEAESGTVSE